MIDPSSFEGMKELKRILLEVDIVLRYSNWNYIVISDNVYLDGKYVKKAPDNLFRNYKGKVCSADLYYLPLDESYSNIQFFITPKIKLGETNDNLFNNISHRRSPSILAGIAF